MHPEDNVSFEPVVGRAPLILGGHDFHSITDAVAAPMERTPSLGWWIAQKSLYFSKRSWAKVAHRSRYEVWNRTTFRPK